MHVVAIYTRHECGVMSRGGSREKQPCLIMTRRGYEYCIVGIIDLASTSQLIDILIFTNEAVLANYCVYAASVRLCVAYAEN